MEYADAIALHSLSDTDPPWHEVARSLGDANARRAHAAVGANHVLTATSWFFYASACYRAAQAAMPDDAERWGVYATMVDAFGSAGALRDPPFEYETVSYDGGIVRMWKILPPGVSQPATVIVVGGLDGWREEHEFATRALVERGMSVILMEAPGQGQTRMLDGTHLHEGFERAFSAVIDHLVAEPSVSGQVGVWGNSFGGNLAAWAAIADPRVSAVCVNGGSSRPTEVMEHFPEMTAKAEALFGVANADEAIAALDRLTLSKGDLERLTAPLLVLHGTADPIFGMEDAEFVHSAATSADKTFLLWDDGEHCLYNHPHERNVTIADWFDDRM